MVRKRVLAAALVAATLAVLLVGMWARSVATEAAAGVRMRSVLVARSSVDVGTPVARAEKVFESRDLPGDMIPAGAMARGEVSSDQVVAVPILPGQVVQKAMFGTAAASGGLPIRSGRLGVSVRLDDPERVAGFVRPGSQVAVLATIANPGGEKTTKVLLARVDVAAVGPTTAVTTGDQKEPDEPVPSAILTLSVSQVQAEKLVYARTAGDLCLALLSKDSAVSARGTGVTDKNLFD